MFKNFGFRKEDEFIVALNGKRICDVNKNLQFMIKTIFGIVNEESILEAKLVEDFQKPDFSITCNGITKYVSLKSGRTTVVHEEYFLTFIPFLRESGLSEESIKFFLEFCYGDGTIDGTGTQSYDYTHLRLMYETQIKMFNREVISNKSLIKKVIYRCLFKGSRETNIEADYIYFGDIHFGYLASQQQIFRHIERRDWRFMDNPHIGPLQFKPHYRGHDLGEEKEKRRHQADLWWANLNADIAYISERYDG